MSSSGFVKTVKNKIMKNLFIYLFIIALVIGGIIFFNSINSKQKNTQTENKGLEKVQVSASFYPLYFLAQEIGGDRADVKNITPAGTEPHDYDPTPQDIVRIQESKLLIVNGAGFEPWLDKIKSDLSNTAVINTSEGVVLQEGTEEHEEESNKDPHIWLSPVLAKSQADKILQGYTELDPENGAFYEENAQKLKLRLDELDEKFRQGLNSCELNSFVTSHAAFGYLAREYNLTQVAISGLSPDEEPSAKDLADVANFVKENNIKYIFFETLVSPKLSETIASEVGAQTLVLDPIEGLSEDDIRSGKNYFTVMEDNLKNLQKALQCTK